MKGKIVLLDLTSQFLVLALVMAASAQPRTVGVSVGNTWRYSTAADWSSTDPTAKPPPDVVEYNDTEWLQVTVTGVSGTNISAQMTAHFKNSTEESESGWIDIDTGNNENMTYMIISANLTVGDPIYTVSLANWLLNETVQRTYLNGLRETNHVNTTSSTAVQYLASNLYWDKETGIFVELSTQNIFQVSNYTTSWSMGLQIISSNIWVIPEFPTWVPTLLLLIALISATTIVSTQRRRVRTP
jgi:hypothetical protein